MRRLAPLLAVVAAMAAPAALAATTHDVRARGNAWLPPSTTVTSGDTVRWTNEDLVRHTVTFTGSDPNELLPGTFITITFRTPGTYRYQCDVHPQSMQGTVVVQATSTSSSTTSTTRPPATTSTTQDARGSAITAPPDTSTTTTTTTTTTVPTDDTTTTTASFTAEDGSAAPPPGDGDDPDVDGPGAVAAILLFAVSGAGSFLVRKGVVR